LMIRMGSCMARPPADPHSLPLRIRRPQAGRAGKDIAHVQWSPLRNPPTDLARAEPIARSLRGDPPDRRDVAPGVGRAHIGRRKGDTLMTARTATGPLLTCRNRSSSTSVKSIAERATSRGSTDHPVRVWRPHCRGQCPDCCRARCREEIRARAFFRLCALAQRLRAGRLDRIMSPDRRLDGRNIRRIVTFAAPDHVRTANVT